MPRFIPDVRVNDITHDSERYVYEALGHLSEGYVVLHSFPWLRPARDLADQPLREGEADFLVLHPERGLLVVEVKGGAPELRGRIWFRGGKQMRDPFDQARRNRYALLDAVEDATNRRIHRGLFTHGDVVVFPHAQYDGPLPLNTDSRVFLDGPDLDNIAARIEDAFRAWRRNETRLTSNEFASLLDALMPKLRLLRCAGVEIAAESRRIVQVTLDQQATLLGLLASPRVLVEGVAGSGKTLLALEFARTLALKGARVLLLCFNKHLASWLSDQAGAVGNTGRALGSLDVATFHSFGLALARRARIDFDVPQGDAQEFWDAEVPLILEQAIEVLQSRGETVQYDALIVDEGQDFSPDWWVTIESLTRGGRNGRLYAFLDLRQSLRHNPMLPSVPFAARFQMNTNCRNTQSIARSAAVLVGAEVTLLPSSPEGEVPVLRRASSAASDGGIAIDEVRKLLASSVEPRQIALIGPASHGSGPLAKHKDINGIRLVDDAGDWRRGAGILVTTARAFKGLEADIVVLYGLSGFGPLFSTTDIYVAWTRARHRLIVVCHGAEVRAAVEAALADAALTVSGP